MENKKIAVPGDLVSDRPVRVEGTFVENNKTFASVVSLVSGDKIIPLKGCYLPNYGDYVVGIVSLELFSGYILELNSPYEGVLSNKDTREEFKVGDVLAVKIMAVDEVNKSMLGEPRRLNGGEIIEVESVKVPRIIGRNGSMLQMLRDYTHSDIFVGKNGRVYIKGGDSVLASLSIQKICKESHTSGLTDRMQAFLQEESAKNANK